MRVETISIPPDGGTRRQRECEAVAQLLRSMLGPEARLGHLPSGAPMVAGVGHISVTHSQRLAAIAISEEPVGIDAEEWRPALERVRSRFLSEAEEALCPDLLLAWTIKEAVYKCAGVKELGASGIEIISEAEARALGRVYAIESWREGPTVITLAQPKV